MKLLVELIKFSTFSGALDWASDAECYGNCCPLENEIAWMTGKEIPKIRPGYKVIGNQDEETLIVGCKDGYM